ncbi:aquaporin-like protein [Cokeromyces recurvatus]|uniref:aquaporin-like protein n=1 Tax=Cokeromyces recurvatus TaxID=90255 RepID=UPI0022211AEF|nr:aquaporin-like protein [Cokeromyces recurvatus]KAI7898422.1 aquaporin-like protein [Cokeromyces recurvatus]
MGNWELNSSSNSSVTQLVEEEERQPLLSQQNNNKLISSSSSYAKFNNPVDDISTAPKTRCATIISYFQRFRKTHREFLAEFIGTMILVLLLCGVAAEETLFATNSHKSWLTSSIGSGLAVLIAICVSGHVSGAHLNPAITLTFSVFSGFPIHKVPIYIAAQCSGAFVGAAVLYILIQPALTNFDHGERQILGEFGTAGIFGTYAPPHVTLGTAVASEMVGTALLLLIVMVSGHPNNLPFKRAQGIMVAVGIMILVMSLGYTSGFSLNPARDFGPRLFTAIAGWGMDVFWINGYYAIVPLIAPLLGGLVGGFVYILFID